MYLWREGSKRGPELSLQEQGLNKSKKNNRRGQSEDLKQHEQGTGRRSGCG